MPILNDIMDHPVLGRERKRGILIGREQGLELGLERGLEQGLEQGLEKGREEGERQIILRLIAKRFGEVPPAAKKRIAAMSATKLERFALRLLDARSLNELLG